MITKKEIALKAFDMFRHWSAMAKHDYSKHNFDIIDETKLVNDLTDAINKAFKAINADDKAEKRQQEGFDEAFLLSFICSNLNTTWYYEYIVKQNDDYKEFVAFKALKIYLEFEKLADIRITNIYKRLLKNDCNLSEIKTSINHENLKAEYLHEIDEIPNGEILKAINNQINSFVNKFTKSYIPDIMVSVDRYFSKDDILAIINNNVEQ